ncbi:SCO family protein [Shewanella sp. OMA3-2]|uniref:SCO family protein n=1 Tax=Shewanella sp. OMA3-2 TaxID=2908650 RepID=UPI001F483AE5|nr:SCO family protein [Shewanella sp. OMA3-2]UJF22489.1 SCO family protein [Shewanella sp. OMA3-2]
MTKTQKWSAAAFIITAIFLVPLLMVTTQFIRSTDGQSRYGIHAENLAPLSFQWQDTRFNSHIFPANKAQFTYLFAGFLSCSEICPIRIQQLHQLENAIAEDSELDQADIVFMFITIDPDNDTPAIRQQMIDDKSSRFISAALTEPDLLTLSQHLSENIQAHSPINNHVGNLYLIAPNGRIARIYTSKHLSTDKMLAELRQYITSN